MTARAGQPLRHRPPRSRQSARAPRTRLAAWPFLDPPRLGLDALLVQLVDRAGDVLAAQGRLRGLLRANALVASDLSLPVVLRQMVVAARDLLGALVRGARGNRPRRGA